MEMFLDVISIISRCVLNSEGNHHLYTLYKENVLVSSYRPMKPAMSEKSFI